MNAPASRVACAGFSSFIRRSVLCHWRGGFPKLGRGLPNSSPTGSLASTAGSRHFTSAATKPNMGFAARQQHTKGLTSRCNLSTAAQAAPITEAKPPDQVSTTVTLNPRDDEDGQEMKIEITPRATKRLQEIMNSMNNQSLALRVTVESGGCHGFQYLMSLVKGADINRDEDTIFEASDGSSETPARVVMDEASLGLLKGSKVEFTEELIGSQFKIVGNPAASSSCGCGTSFDVKS